jgi:hypothetical protein
MRRTIILLLLLSVVLLAGCQASPAPTASALPSTDLPSASSTPLPPPTATQLPPTNTPLPPTNTPLPPTSTSLPSATPIPPTATAAPLALANDGFKAWCSHEQTAYPVQPWLMPAGADVLSVFEGSPQLLIPNRGCTLTFMFNQALPSGVILLAKDKSNYVWFKKPLDVASDNPAVGYKELTHDYIMDPPQWIITYKFALQTTDGQSLWESEIRFKDSNMPKWLCVDGTIIDKRSKKCLGPIELEPGQPGFGTPGPNPY